VFAADGLQAPLSAVAKKAGVGQGSLYRHFPDRLSLAVAVFDENLDQLDEAVATPDATLDDLLDAIVDQVVVSTAFIDLIWRSRNDDRVTHLGDRLEAIVETVLAREQAAGRLGEHVETADVLLAITMLADVISRADAADRPAVAQRAWSLLHHAFLPRD
jgi:AcrR family transcriptional regulator